MYVVRILVCYIPACAKYNFIIWHAVYTLYTCTACGIIYCDIGVRCDG